MTMLHAIIPMPSAVTRRNVLPHSPASTSAVDLEVCPNGSKVQFTCTNAYQCRSGETCLFGGCCQHGRKKSLHGLEKLKKSSPGTNEEIRDVTADLQVIQDPYSSDEQLFSHSEDSNSASINSVKTELPAKTPPSVKKVTPKGAQMPAFAPTDECLVDNRVHFCSLNNPCPEISECVDGQCCRVAGKRCRNGLRPLMLPTVCRKSDDCPIASFCEDKSCCPLDSNFMDQPLKKKIPFSEEESLVKKPKSAAVHVDSNSATRKLQCLTNQGCLLGALCPVGFTCTLDGRCCQLPVSCPDGSAPEAMCGGLAMCPSPLHICYAMAERMNVCCRRETVPTIPVVGSMCPMGSVEGNKQVDSCAHSHRVPIQIRAPWEPVTMVTAAVPVQCPHLHVPAQKHLRTARSLTKTKSIPKELEENDWPVGPPGYGYPDHLARLDSVLVKATGDGSTWFR
ncbi:hypothetical protein COOONC_06881 [Cooperia oncophora]